MINHFVCVICVICLKCLKPAGGYARTYQWNSLKSSSGFENLESVYKVYDLRNLNVPLPLEPVYGVLPNLYLKKPKKA